MSVRLILYAKNDVGYPLSVDSMSDLYCCLSFRFSLWTSVGSLCEALDKLCRLPLPLACVMLSLSMFVPPSPMIEMVVKGQPRLMVSGSALDRRKSTRPRLLLSCLSTTTAGAPQSDCLRRCVNVTNGSL